MYVVMIDEAGEVVGNAWHDDRRGWEGKWCDERTEKV